MISNYDLQELGTFFHIPVIVCMKDELKFSKPSPISNFVINLESSSQGNGSHWLALCIKNKDCSYFDSYGMLPPEEIIAFCKKIKGSHLSYNTKEIQSMTSSTCGLYCFAFIFYLNYKFKKNVDNIYTKSSSFSDLFSNDTNINNNILKNFYKKMPLSKNLILLNKLYSQK